MPNLRIDSAPFRPSLLRNHYTPRSPVSPLQSVAKRVCYSRSIPFSDGLSRSDSSIHSFPSPPSSPYKWIWRCHECHTSYQIGTTRRCLLDDHELCYGQPIKKRSKKGKKKTRACQSQFDYTGWQAWGAWKRSGREEQETMDVERNCAILCDWPSQCRWNRVQQEETVEGTCPIPAASEADSQLPETEPTSTREEAAIQPNKSADGLISKIGTATQRLTLQWTSMLTPIEEEPPQPDMAAIEDFLSSAKTVAGPKAPSINVPLVAPLQVTKATSTNRSDVGRGSSVFGLDFGFHWKGIEEQRVPSLTTGFNHIVASTVGIALSTPSRCRRCVSDPPTQSVPLQEQPRRRASVG
ncbi:MAG: hypothetical protein Q9213_004427 [Squamulea squamosa]